jgi:hypothetical protein
MGAHVADGDALPGGAGSGVGGGSLYSTGRDATSKAAANLLSSLELAARERAGPSDEFPRAVVTWSLGLKQRENPLCAVGGPRGDHTPLRLAKRLS